MTDPNGMGGRYFAWTPVIAGALCAAAFSFILVTFAVAIGLGVSSASPTWRDASAALAVLSGMYLIIQAIVCFGLGGYIAGRTRPAVTTASALEAEMAEEDVERRDGLHGLASWALAVLMGAVLASLVAASISSRPSIISSSSSANSTVAEPLLSYELDRMFRAGRRPANADLTSARAEAGRILLTTSSHSGVSSDDRAYLTQLVVSATGLSAPEAERRADVAIADSGAAIARSRRTTVIVAFSLATATLLGAVAAWAGACAGGRHRDGAALPNWMLQSNAFGRRRMVVGTREPQAPRPIPG